MLLGVRSTLLKDEAEEVLSWVVPSLSSTFLRKQRQYTLQSLELEDQAAFVKMRRRWNGTVAY